ncbi:hypothetical protein Tco_1229838 [Tanacetum coccineum]
MSNPKFAQTHNLVGIIDFLNASSIIYALKIQALVDGKKVIVTETSVRQDLHLKDVEGTYCLPTATIFAEMERMGAKTTAWNEFSSSMASAITCLATNQKFNFSKYICDNMVKNLEGGDKFLMYPRFVQVFLYIQVEGMSKHKEIYATPSHTKKVFANMKRERKDFSGRDTPLFPTMMVQAQQEEGERKGTKIPSSSGDPIADEAANEEHIPTPSYDPPQSGEDRLQLNELMEICTNLQKKVLDLETSKVAQAQDISSLKQRVKKLKKKKKSRPYGLRRLYKGRKIADLDTDAEVILIDETQGRNDEDFMFDTGVLNGDEVFEEPMVNAATTTSSIPVSIVDPVTTAGEVVTTASVDVTTSSATTTTVNELTLAQTLIKIKAAKPKAVTTAATTTTTIRPKARGVVVQEPSEFKTTTSPSQSSQLSKAKEKGKAKMVEPEKPLKEKDQIAFDEEVARNLEAQLQVELEEEEEKLARQREEEANISLIESWDKIQAMMDADF